LLKAYLPNTGKSSGRAERQQKMITLQRMTGLLTAVMAATSFAQTIDELQKRERCAVRLSVALVGKAPALGLLQSIDPQASVDQLLDSTDFVEKFSRFANATFNRTPGAAAEEDAAYFLAYEVLSKRKAWKEMFLGQYRVEKNAADTVVVVPDAQGLGYFRSPAWKKRYAGNEVNGVLLSMAYRIMNNTVGLKLIASTNAPEADTSATGRQAAGCRACHYDSLFALDKAAAVLGRRTGTMANVTFDPPSGDPSTLLGGISVRNDKELVTALVESEAFRFNTCRLAFKYIYGRAENACEGPAFDRCMTDFKAMGTMQSAVAAVVKDPTFCQ
jgi:hypothetical protein